MWNENTCGDDAGMLKPFRHTGLYLREAREKIDLPQADLAEKLGFHLQNISNMERGVSGCSSSHCKKIARYLKCDPKQIAKEMTKDYQARYLNKAKLK